MTCAAHGTTRWEQFRAEEQPLLAPLPATRFEEVTWKEVKAGRNYHVSCDYQRYSVPYRLAGRLLRANRDHRLPTMIASQTGPAHWVTELPDRVAADSIVNRLANRARPINLGDIDMRKLRHDQTRANNTYWE